MGLFGFGEKRENIVDLAERYRQKKEREASAPSNMGISDEEATDASTSTDSESVEEKRKKLAKRLVDMVNRLDDLSNKIYHLQQRIEVLERKADLRSGTTE